MMKIRYGKRKENHIYYLKKRKGNQELEFFTGIRKLNVFDFVTKY